MKYTLIGLVMLIVTACDQQFYYKDAISVVKMLNTHSIVDCETSRTNTLQAKSAVTCNLNENRLVNIYVFEVMVSEHCIKVRAACSGGRIWDKKYMEVPPEDKPMRLTKHNVILDIIPVSEREITPIKERQNKANISMSFQERTDLAASIMKDLDSNWALSE